MKRSPDAREQLQKAWKVLQHADSVRYFAKRGDGAALGGRLNSPQALIKAGENLSDLGFDTYLHLNPSVGHGLKATSQQVTDWHRILIDLDPVDPSTDAEETALEALRRAEHLHRGMWEAAEVVDTGRGAHLWIEFHPQVVTDGTYRRIERATANFLNRLRHAWDGTFGYRIDSKCHDLGRIVRCPGTVNTRNGRTARFLRTAFWPLDPEEFLTAWYTAPEPFEVERPQKVSNLIEASPHLNNLAREFLHNGVEEGDRHHAAHASALSLIRLGMGLDSVRYWVLRGGHRCRPRLPKSDILHCIQTAIKKERDEGL